MSDDYGVEILRQFIRIKYKSTGFKKLLNTVNTFFHNFSDIQMIHQTQTSFIYRARWNEENIVIKITTNITREINIFHVNFGSELLHYYNARFFQEPASSNIAFVAFLIEACNCNLREFVEKENSLNRPITNNKKLHILLDIAHDIDVIHKNGYVHRRIEPTNILINLDENDNFTKAKLSDFSMLRVLEKQAGATVGQVLICYAPEMLDFESTKGTTVTYGPEVDIWAFGIIVYWLFTGEFPCDPNFRDEIELRNILFKFASYVEDLQPSNDISQEILELIQGCIKVDPDERLTYIEISNMLDNIIFKDSEPEPFDIFDDIGEELFF